MRRRPCDELSDPPKLRTIGTALRPPLTSLDLVTVLPTIIRGWETWEQGEGVGGGDKCNTVYEEEDAVRTLGTTGRVGGWEGVRVGGGDKRYV